MHVEHGGIYTYGSFLCDFIQCSVLHFQLECCLAQSCFFGLSVSPGRSPLAPMTEGQRVDGVVVMLISLRDGSLLGKHRAHQHLHCAPSWGFEFRICTNCFAAN